MSTKTMQQLCEEAINVQDACNLSGVVHGFSQAITDLRKLLDADGVSTDAINRHPVCVMWSSKIASLSGSESVTTFSTAYSFCKDYSPEHEDRMLIAKFEIGNAEHFDKTVAFAKQVGKWTGQNGLRTCLERLVQIHGNTSQRLSTDTKKPRLYKDFAAHSFEFVAGGLQGGVIFHGKHDNGGDGGAPTFSVSLEPTDGWSIHT